MTQSGVQVFGKWDTEIGANEKTGGGSFWAYDLLAKDMKGHTST
jgi:hypothetical protein